VRIGAIVWMHVVNRGPARARILGIRYDHEGKLGTTVQLRFFEDVSTFHPTGSAQRWRELYLMAFEASLQRVES